MRKRDEILHKGEMEAQRLFGVEAAWDDERLHGMFRTEIPDRAAQFIESLPFFFIATSNDTGACDCSYRGREYNEDGSTQPLLKVVDEKSFVFPDLYGNKLYNSIGNMLTNPQIGCLFINFETAERIRINGHVQIIEQTGDFDDLWPDALAYIKVTVDQLFGNCKKRIPKMVVDPGA
jgi:hypothetical protein